jgi:MFS family permease
MDYLRFMAVHRRFLSFGLLAAWTSSFGQTFFIAFFSGELRAEFDLGYAQFGALYAGATFASGAFLLGLGRQLDALALPRFTLLVGAGLAAAACLLAAAQSLWMLVAAVFLLRLCGQGLMSHIAVTSMARYFGARRGRAVAVAALGFPLGEALLPLLLVLLASQFGWRASWWLLGALLAFLLLPALLWLLCGHERRHASLLAEQQALPRAAAPGQWTLGKVLRDRRFYRMLPGLLAVPFAITGVFFHQVPLAAAKGWSLELLAASLIAYALGRIGASLLAGSLIDRFGSSPLLPLAPLPLILGLIVLGLTGHPAAAWIFMLFAGLSAGTNGALTGTVFAELYGVLHLGAIRGAFRSAMITATAAAPLLMGLLLDAGWSLTHLLLAGALLLSLALLPIFAQSHSFQSISVEGN